MDNQNPGTEAQEAPAPEPEKPQKFTAPDGTADTGRYAAYDTTYGRYVGGVHDTRGKAREAAKAAGSESYEVVEV